jgi:hypothetical protein
MQQNSQCSVVRCNVVYALPPRVEVFMSFIQMRTVPGLFIGRRTLICAEPGSDEADGYRCGACGSVIHSAADPEELRDVVVKCACGEFNQV